MGETWPQWGEDAAPAGKSAAATATATEHVLLAETG